MKKLIEIGKIRPLGKSDEKNARFGIGLEKLDRNVFDPSKTYDRLADIGMKYVRLQSGWMRTEKEEGIYDFAWLDEIVDNLVSRGMEPWLCLCYGNPVYTESAKKYFGAVGCPPVFTEREKRGWANYCSALAGHYKGRIKMFEVWNEPDGDHCWKHGTNGKEYGEFCIDTAKAIRKTYPEAKILGGSTCDREKGFTWIEPAMQTGMFKYVDAITYHEYTVDETQIFERVSALKAVCAKYGNLGLIQGENGCPSSGDGFGALNTGAFTPQKQAKLILRRQIVDMLSGVEFSSVFTTVDMIEALHGTVGDKSSYLDYGFFGLLAAEFDENGRSIGEYKPKPSYYAFQNLCAVFGKDIVLSEVPVFFFPTMSPALFAREEERKNLLTAGFCNRKNGGLAFVYWKPAQLLSTSFEGTISFQASGFTDAVLTDLLTGTIYRIPEEMREDLGCGVTLFKHVPVKDYPLIISSANFMEKE